MVLAAFNYSPILAVLAAAAVILTAGYILWTIQRVFLGRSEAWKGLPDLNLREIVIAVPLVVLTIAMGIFPHPLVLSWMSPGRPVVKGLSRPPASSMSQRSGRSRKPYPEFLTRSRHRQRAQPWRRGPAERFKHRVVQQLCHAGGITGARNQARPRTPRDRNFWNRECS